MQSIKKKKIGKYLPVMLTDDERLEKADELAEASQAVDNANANKRYVLSQMQTEIKTAEARREKLAGIVSSKREYREVTVEVQFDFEKGEYREIRTDTGELVTQRSMTDDERQISILDPGLIAE